MSQAEQIARNDVGAHVVWGWAFGGREATTGKNAVTGEPMSMFQRVSAGASSVLFVGGLVVSLFAPPLGLSIAGVGELGQVALAESRTLDVLRTSVAGGAGSGVAARGGPGPVSQGAAGVERAVADLEAAGGRVLSREVTIEVGRLRTRPDLFVELPSGQQAFLEIKTGESAGLTPNQTAAFPQIWAQGGIPRGANAAAAFLTPGVPLGPTPVWTIHYPWPLP